jgi:hypothetical protein
MLRVIWRSIAIPLLTQIYLDICYRQAPAFLPRYLRRELLLCT